MKNEEFRWKIENIDEEYRTEIKERIKRRMKDSDEELRMQIKNEECRWRTKNTDKIWRFQTRMTNTDKKWRI